MYQSNAMWQRIGLISLCFFLCAGCASARTSVYSQLSIQSAVVLVEIADDLHEKTKGLQQRKELQEGTGMLFVYDHEQLLSFWMKDTVIPLDIAYIDQAGIIREIHHLEPLSEKAVTSGVPVRYALEVPRGWFHKQTIQEGAHVQGLPIEEISEKINE